MPNTLTKHNGMWNLTLDGSSDFDAGIELNIAAIQVHPNAQNDTLIIRKDSVSGGKEVDIKMSADTDDRWIDFSAFPNGCKTFRPCIAGADVTTSIRIIFHIL